MIDYSRRSVTRFFIPLIDVLILLFCIFLLMPIVAATGDDGETGNKVDLAMTRADREELERLRNERHATLDVERLQLQERQLTEQLDELRREKIAVLRQRLAIRVLEIGDDGRLFFFDQFRPNERRQEITAENFRDLIDRERRAAGERELYFLFLYPRPEVGNPVFPLRGQRETYDRWFADVAHGYDIPLGGKE